MTITSTYDHRVIQGAESGAFLRRIDGLLGGADDFYPDVFSTLAADFAKAPPIEAAGEPAASSGVRPLAATSTDDLKAVAAAVALVRAYRSFGHLAARLDPLGSPPPGDPALDPEPLGLTPEVMARIPADAAARRRARRDAGRGAPRAAGHLLRHHRVRGRAPRQPRGAACGCAASSSPVSTAAPLNADEQRALLERLTQVEGLERFLHRAYLGQKRFSIEGLDVMVPVLDQVLADAAEAGTHEAVIGMAHRGRLNVLAHIVGVTYEAILAEFEAGRGGTRCAPRRAARTT